jgi:hypothetical protein
VKFLIFIFSVYILFVSTISCCAADNCNDDAQQTETAGKQEHEDGAKNCSPFNLCGSCVGFIVAANSFTINTPQKLLHTVFAGFIQSYHSQYISSYWQPPRLG